MRAIPQELSSEIVKRYAEGQSSSHIVKEMGIPERTVLRYIRKAGLPTRGSRKIDAALFEQIAQEYADGAGSFFLSQKYRGTSKTIVKAITQKGVKLRSRSEAHQTFDFDKHYFDQIDHPNKAYWLGFLWADGHNDVKHNNLMFRLSKRDIDILELFKADLKSEHPIRIYSVDRKGKIFDYAHFTIKNQHLSATLLKLGMAQNKTYYPEWPPIPDHLWSHFVRGFFDGDGCWYKNKKRSKTTFMGKVTAVGNRKLLDNISKIVECQTGIKFKIYPKNDNPEFGELWKGGRLQMVVFGNWLYKDSNPTNRMDRKYKIYLDARSYS